MSKFDSTGTRKEEPLTLDVLIGKIEKSTETCGSPPQTIQISDNVRSELLQSMTPDTSDKWEFKKGKLFILGCEIIKGKDRTF